MIKAIVMMIVMYVKAIIRPAPMNVAYQMATIHLVLTVPAYQMVILLKITVVFVVAIM